MYLGPNVPHAYLTGDCVECMANRKTDILVQNHCFLVSVVLVCISVSKSIKLSAFNKVYLSVGLSALYNFFISSKVNRLWFAVTTL